jgi:predicted ATPase/DNA-binding winged helix-turn-helix (wHTH) protein
MHVTADEFSFGPFCLVRQQRVLLEDGEPVHLGSRAIDILVVLLERAGEVVRKDELLARVWPTTAVGETNLRVHIAALRKALRDGESGRRYITNVPLQGYCFVGPVTRGASAPPTAGATRSSSHPRGLPHPSPRLVGRDDVVAAVVGQLPVRRFVSLVGTGGVGKTSVALAVAHRLTDHYEEGIHFVDFATMAPEARIPGLLAAVVGLRVDASSTNDALEHVRDKRALLVLDSCELAVDVAAAVAAELVERCPALDVLTTSREPLRAEGENVYRIGPLTLPPSKQLLTAEVARRHSAVELFVDLAIAALDSFVLSDANVQAVVEICRRLDGIPLAIQLAAAQVPVFGLRELAARLDDRFTILATGRRTAPPRHQTLRATLDWSYETLAPPERTLLHRLAVFRGAFTLDCAIAVVTDEDGLSVAGFLQALGTLAAKSLLVVDPGAEQTLYRLLETMRQYAWEKLDANERGRICRRYAERRLLLVKTGEERATGTLETFTPALARSIREGRPGSEEVHVYPAGSFDRVTSEDVRVLGVEREVLIRVVG